MSGKPFAPRSRVWDKVKRPDLVTRIVMTAATGVALIAACTVGLLLFLLRWLFFPGWPVKTLALVAILFGIVGFSIGSRSATALVHKALRMPDDHA